eukprot:1529182-Rhodomonas_salina.1
MSSVEWKREFLEEVEVSVSLLGSDNTNLPGDLRRAVCAACGADRRRATPTSACWLFCSQTVARPSEGPQKERNNLRECAVTAAKGMQDVQLPHMAAENRAGKLPPLGLWCMMSDTDATVPFLGARTTAVRNTAANSTTSISPAHRQPKQPTPDATVNPQ